MRSLASTAWRGCTAVGLAPLVRRGYLLAVAMPRGWRHVETIHGVEATFATTAWPEYRRVTTFHGERRFIASMLGELEGDEVVWDVGANVGLWACFVANALEEGTLVGIEPTAENEQRLRENLGRNAPPTRWQTVRVALDRADGQGRLASAHHGSERTAIGAGHHYLSEAGWREIYRCRAETLVDRGVPRPEVLKVDVQGAELDVLRGMGDVLNVVQLAYVELHPRKLERYDATEGAVKSFLEDRGFAITDLGRPDDDRDDVYVIRASR